jgi:hypothetical protein
MIRIRMKMRRIRRLINGADDGYCDSLVVVYGGYVGMDELVMMSLIEIGLFMYGNYIL